MDAQTLRRRVRLWLVFFIAALAASGVTAIPLLWELTVLRGILESQPWIAGSWPDLIGWLTLVDTALVETFGKYPFMAYGMDWLAFAHIVIAIGFIGPLRDPVRNVWVVELGMIACVLVIPVALIFGGLRGIPFYWRLIDCSFGVVGIIPLALVRRDIGRMATLQQP
jgi:hypothetical protein